MIDLRNTIIKKKEIPENENPNKIVYIVEKILDKPPSHLTRVAKVFDHTRIKILTPKQMLQRSPIALAQVNAGNTSEN